IGGGVGLVAVCDNAGATPQTKFGEEEGSVGDRLKRVLVANRGEIAARIAALMASAARQPPTGARSVWDTLGEWGR
ncbi:MAG: hypothetical protein ACXW2Q_14205, partial [Thermoanaerobaculia bacterium]